MSSFKGDKAVKNPSKRHSKDIEKFKAYESRSNNKVEELKQSYEDKSDGSIKSSSSFHFSLES